MRKFTDPIHPMLLLALAGLVVLIAADPGLAQSGKRAIEQVKGDVYRFQDSFHHAVFVETADGIVVTDPINAEAVAWLKSELAERFGKSVTHMVLSHHHGDHASGGEAWGEEVTVVAHENARPHIAAGEVQTALPEITFTDRMTFSSGGKTFELTYLGEGHSDDLIAMVVRPENVAFVVDAVSPRRLPYRDFSGTDIDQLIGQIKTIESLEFDILAPGHSVLGDKQDAADMRVYVEDLKAAVKAELATGKSVDETVVAVKMDHYADWASYDQWLELNVRGMARWLKASGQVP